MLTQSQIDIIKATAPVVAEHAREITETFYPLMFERYPEVQAFFNQAHQQTGSQRQALANAVIAYASNIDRLEVLGDAVSLIAQKHCSLDIRPEQYPIVGECLMAAIGEVLGDAVTPEVADAWGAAYQQLADILINAEAEIYQANAARPGGWEGEREFRVADKVVESEEITSFHLLPVSGEQQIDFLPGQYIALVLNIDGQVMRRNYSLSDAPGRAGLRISVKREAGGEVSNYLHDRVQVGEVLNVTAPCGDFVLNEHSKRPLALVTGGVGITPAISMLNASVASGREIIFIHAARHGGVHAFADHVESLAEKHDNLKHYFVYNEPRPDDKPHAKGLLDDSLLGEWLPGIDVDLYFLGPVPFMKAVNQHVEKLGVPEAQVRYEFFGPLQALSA